MNANDPEVVIVEASTKLAAREDHCHNLRKIGEGLHGEVYSSDQTPYVVKTFFGNDLGYLSWIQTIAELGQNNPHVPKIMKVILYRLPDYRYDFIYKKPGKTSMDTYVVYMEKLDDRPCRANTGGEWGRYSRDRYASTIDVLMRKIRLDPKNFDWNTLRPVHRDLCVMMLLAAEKAGLEWFDLHSANVMARGRRFVVIDPLAS